MSLSDFFTDTKAVLVEIGLLIGGVWAWLINRKKNAVAISKEQAEKDDIIVDTRVKLEKFNQEKSERYEVKIEVLSAKLQAMQLELEKCAKLHKEAMIIINELKAQNTIYKTIRK